MPDSHLTHSLGLELTTRNWIPPRSFIFSLVATIVLGWALEPQLNAQDSVEFGRQVRPILAKHCFACHGRDEAARQAELRLDVREAAIDSQVIVAGDADRSELISRIESTSSDEIMPPLESGHKLSATEKQILRKWIQQGAKYEKHWSFVLPQKSELPEVQNKQWPRNPIDYFVLKRIEQAGGTVSADADRLIWLRRVSLDLTGLPPTLQEAQDFLADGSASAEEKVVNRLLNSKSFGEHWARLWLDLARYADTKGYEKDRHREIWRYRDWVIDALNADMPYDQFTLEQLAGDLLPNRTSDQILATAFHRNTMTNEEGGTDNEEFRVAAVKDRVDTTLQVWMGLTMGCSKCHSHKYDPISLKDYYSFYALFNQTQDNDTEGPLWPTPTRKQAAQIAEMKRQIAQCQALIQQRSPKFEHEFAAWKKKFETVPFWEPLKLLKFQSEQEVSLTQQDNGILIATGNRPDKDTWSLELELGSERKVHSLRLEYFPQAQAGGAWPDKNVAIGNLTVEALSGSDQTTRVKLKNPRASFSQKGWEVRRVIDDNPRVGWAISPKFNQAQVAVFDFAVPVSVRKLRITLAQQYGDQLLLARCRISAGSHPANWYAAELKPNLESIFARNVYAETQEAYKKLSSSKQQLAKLQAAIPKTPVMLELAKAKQRVTKIHRRGNFLDPSETVQPSVLQQFGAMPAQAPLNRIGVARWLTSGQNPLTARVMANRIWARIFGVGLVETEEDFGTQGSSPSHPKLLDWLAVDFREQGWSIKNLIKNIVLSRTYRQASTVSLTAQQKDPRNRLLTRGPRFRLSAEVVRDQALAASGLLTRKVGGPSVMPPQPDGVWKSTYNGQKWKNATGPDRYRRAIYTYLKRTSPYPALQTFDAGSGEVCQVRRIRTNTPLQALVTLNDPAFFEAAGALAKRMNESSRQLKQKLAHGFQRVAIRPPSPAELARLIELYHSLEQSLDDPGQLLQAAGLKSGDARLVVVASVMLNLDETVTKN